VRTDVPFTGAEAGRRVARLASQELHVAYPRKTVLRMEDEDRFSVLNINMSGAFSLSQIRLTRPGLLSGGSTRVPRTPIEEGVITGRLEKRWLHGPLSPTNAFVHGGDPPGSRSTARRERNIDRGAARA
jgi:hypothetical protein